MNHSRYVAYTLSNPSNWSHFKTDLYSTFKYGCGASTEYFARIISNLVMSQCDLDNEWLITSAAYKNVPTASNNLLSCIKQELSYASPMLSAFSIRRRQVYARDFASLNPQERFLLISQVDLEVDEEMIKGKRIIVIDDAYVTGAHEENILRYFKGLPAEVKFFYIADLSGIDKTTTEERLNQVTVNTLEDLLDIIARGNFMLNARILKFLLSYPSPAEFHQFIALVDPRLLHKIYLGCIRDGYDRLPSYTINFHQLRMQVVRSRESKSEQRYVWVG